MAAQIRTGHRPAYTPATAVSPVTPATPTHPNAASAHRRLQPSTTDYAPFGDAPMIRTSSPPLLADGAAPSPAQRHAIIAVLTGSTSRDITVARLAAQQASAAAAQLVLAVPVPAKPFSPTAADLTGRRLAPQAATVATRVLTRLDHPTSSIALIAVPFLDRGSPNERGRRIAVALVEVSRRLAARQLVVNSTSVGELGDARLSAELAAAAEAGRLPVTRLTVVPHAQTIERPPRAAGTMPDKPADTTQAVPPPRPPAEQAVQTEQTVQPEQAVQLPAAS